MVLAVLVFEVLSLVLPLVQVEAVVGYTLMVVHLVLQEVALGLWGLVLLILLVMGLLGLLVIVIVIVILILMLCLVNWRYHCYHY